MKKRILALLLILVMIGTQLQTASAGSVVIYHGDSIFGVDYSRLAIRAKFPAKLTLGELQFEGELVHSSDKRKEDINRMVEETMREMGLSGTDLMNSASIMDLVTSANRLQFAEMAKALASFIPAVGDGIGALIDVLVAGKNPLEASFDIVKGQAKDQIQKTIQDTAEYASKRVIRQGSKYVPIAGHVFNGIMAGIGLIEVDKKCNQALEEMEKQLEKQILFYGACNRKIEKMISSDDVWRIQFDGQKARDIHNHDIWGVSGQMSEWVLSGVLEQIEEIDGFAGHYRGTLWVDIKGLHLGEFFDPRITTTPPFDWTWKHKAAAKKSGGDYWESHETTKLERNIQGEVDVIVTTGKGSQESEVSGSLTSGGDEIIFSFDHTFHNVIPMIIGESVRSWTRYQASDLNQITETSNEDMSEYTVAATGGKGNVWEPLDSKPVLTVYIP